MLENIFNLKQVTTRRLFALTTLMSFIAIATIGLYIAVFLSAVYVALIVTTASLILTGLTGFFGYHAFSNTELQSSTNRVLALGVENAQDLQATQEGSTQVPPAPPVPPPPSGLQMSSTHQAASTGRVSSTSQSSKKTDPITIAQQVQLSQMVARPITDNLINDSKFGKYPIANQLKKSVQQVVQNVLLKFNKTTNELSEAEKTEAREAGENKLDEMILSLENLATSLTNEVIQQNQISAGKASEVNQAVLSALCNSTCTINQLYKESEAIERIRTAGKQKLVEILTPTRPASAASASEGGFFADVLNKQNTQAAQSGRDIDFS